VNTVKTTFQGVLFANSSVVNHWVNTALYYCNRNYCNLLSIVNLLSATTACEVLPETLTFKRPIFNQNMNFTMTKQFFQYLPNKGRRLALVLIIFLLHRWGKPNS